MGVMKRLYEARQGKQNKFAKDDFDGSKSDWDREMSDRFVAPGKKPRKRWTRVDKRARAGYTLVELIVTLIVLFVAGLVLIGIVLCLIAMFSIFSS